MLLFEIPNCQKNPLICCLVNINKHLINMISGLMKIVIFLLKPNILGKRFVPSFKKKSTFVCKNMKAKVQK